MRKQIIEFNNRENLGKLCGGLGAFNLIIYLQDP